MPQAVYRVVLSDRADPMIKDRPARGERYKVGGGDVASDGMKYTRRFLA
jgi:hypothetical protein